MRTATLGRPRPAVARRWLVVGLVVSLGVNLLLGGLVLQTQILSPPTTRPPFSAEQAFQGMASRLPPADSAVLSGALARARPELHRLVEQQRTTHEQIRQILTAATFDATALQRQIEASRDEHRAVTSLIADTLQHALQAMSPEGRAAFARNYGNGRPG